jgi:nickel-dependent lactate racemase
MPCGKGGEVIVSETARLAVAFGHGEMPIALPAGATAEVIRKPPMPRIAGPAEAIRRAFAAPIGSPPLATLARGRRSACILICDITRPVPNGLFLRPMVETLLAGGIPLGAITILVATGLHRPNEGEELAEVVGDAWVMANVRVENHFATRAEDHVDLGVTPGRNTPIFADRRFVEADLRIVTGLVEPHFMAGWSGGRKVVAPGVMGQQTIRTFHAARFMEHPLATSCILEGNPLHEEQLAICRRIGEIFALNTVLDEERKLSFVSFGGLVESHLAAVRFTTGLSQVKVPRRYSTIVTSSAGYPLDKTYYQTVKGMVTPVGILKEGGTIIIASECSEGFGSPEFRASQETLLAMGADRFLAMLNAKAFADIDEWQSEMLLKATRVGRVQLYTSGLDAAERRATGVEIVPSVDAAIAEAVARHQDPTVAVIPEGPYVIPVATAD